MTHAFSFYRKPIRNCLPLKTVTPLDVYNYLTGPYAKQQTDTLRALTDKKQARDYKARSFDYVTFSGEFSYRDESRLIRPSGLLSIDLDHLPGVEDTFQKLLGDTHLQTVLLFRSPSGDGLKWIVAIDSSSHTHLQIFQAVTNYIRITYGLRPDPACKDITRACFLPHDPAAYLSPIYK